MLRVEPKKNRLFVEGLNIVKRHQRPRSLKDTQRGGKVGGVIEKEGPIHVSNVMLVDPQGQQADPRSASSATPTAAASGSPRAPNTKLVTVMAARLKERYESEIKPAADRAVRLQEPDAGADGSRRSRSTWASARPS